MKSMVTQTRETGREVSTEHPTDPASRLAPCGGAVTLDEEVDAAIAWGLRKGGRVVVVTGAGVSAESGIPVYRGENGIWTEGGVESMQMATASFFVEHPRESWEWNLSKRTEIRVAQPNAAHIAIADIGRLLVGRFMLIGQNVDRLHLRAGNRPEETVELHGHLEGMRCRGRCQGVFPIPAALDDWGRTDRLTDAQFALLACPLCGGPSRPHVLWFDEFYDEASYGFATAQRAAAEASLCITAGTSGGVPIAGRLAGIAARAGASLIDVNTADNPLRQLAIRHGGYIEAAATEALPALAAAIGRRLAEGDPEPPDFDGEDA
ncbi:MAG: NAD-dependent deacetylase [Acidimicrobiia bacterium]